MDCFDILTNAMDSHVCENNDLLWYLRFQRKSHGDEFCVDPRHEDVLEYRRDEFYGTFHSEVPRDDDGVVLLPDAADWAIEELDELYYQGELAPFVRTMQRMESIKEELVAAMWHPRRIERLLELGGFEALDNFAGL